MGWKEILKPSLGKIILFLILMGGINYYVITHSFFPDIRRLVGTPLPFWPVGFAFILNPPSVNFSPVNFIVDAAFWYIIAAGIVSLFKKKN